MKLFSLNVGHGRVMITPFSLALACAACYGQSNDALARGMNWGILSLLGVVSVVLACVASFFVYLGKRSAAPTPAAHGAANESNGTRTADPQPPTLAR